MVGTGGGSVISFEKDSKEIYVLKKAINVKSKAITHMTTSPNREHLLSTTDDGQVPSFAAQHGLNDLSSDVLDVLHNNGDECRAENGGTCIYFFSYRRHSWNEHVSEEAVDCHLWD